MKCQQKQPFETGFFQAVAELLAIHNPPTPHIALSGYRSNKMPYLWQALYRSHTCTALALELREVLQEARNDRVIGTIASLFNDAVAGWTKSTRGYSLFDENVWGFIKVCVRRQEIFQKGRSVWRYPSSYPGRERWMAKGSKETNEGFELFYTYFFDF